MEKRQSKQNALAPPLGASPRLGMPAVRHCSVGPPRSAIHGAGRLNRHPCRFTPQIPVEFRPAWFDGAPKIKSQIKSSATAEQQQSQSAKLRGFVGAGLSGRRIAAMAVHQPIHLSTDTPPSQASQLPQESAHASMIRSAVRPPRFACDFDLRHTEPRRGAEWWGKSPLVTLGWAGIPAFPK